MRYTAHASNNYSQDKKSKDQYRKIPLQRLSANQLNWLQVSLHDEIIDFLENRHGEKPLICAAFALMTAAARMLEQRNGRDFAVQALEKTAMSVRQGLLQEQEWLKRRLQVKHWIGYPELSTRMPKPEAEEEHADGAATHSEATSNGGRMTNQHPSAPLESAPDITPPAPTYRVPEPSSPPARASSSRYDDDIIMPAAPALSTSPPQSSSQLSNPPQPSSHPTAKPANLTAPTYKVPDPSPAPASASSSRYDNDIIMPAAPALSTSPPRPSSSDPLTLSSPSANSTSALSLFQEVDTQEKAQQNSHVAALETSRYSASTSLSDHHSRHPAQPPLSGQSFSTHHNTASSINPPATAVPPQPPAESIEQTGQSDIGATLRDSLESVDLQALESIERDRLAAKREAAMKRIQQKQGNLQD